MEFVDPGDPRKGLVFDGRLAEDFKLSTGTWVSVGPLRARILAQAGRAGPGRRHRRPRSRVRGGARVSEPGLCRELADCRPMRRRDVLSHPAVVRDSRTSFDALRRTEHRQLDVRRARDRARRAAVARRARDHRQGLDQPEGGAAASRRARRRPLRGRPPSARVLSAGASRPSLHHTLMTHSAIDVDQLVAFDVHVHLEAHRRARPTPTSTRPPTSRAAARAMPRRWPSTTGRARWRASSSPWTRR